MTAEKQGAEGDRLVRLQKYLAECGVASRREAETIIAEGRVSVNGKTAVIGDKITRGQDTVVLDGEEVSLDKKVYIVLNKPRGVVTSARDTHDRKTVVDCIDGVPARVYPVGRLDMDVAGTLILTNDGELAFRLTHPKYQVDKIYNAWVMGEMSEESAKSLERGVKLEDGLTAPARVAILKCNNNQTLVRLTVHEGRKRLVKRMCAAVGHPVRELTRLAVGTIKAHGLVPGEWRYLSETEIAALRRVTGLDQKQKTPPTA